MADIVFDYDKMAATVDQIRELAAQYRSAGNKLQEDFEAAVSGWEGDSQAAMLGFMRNGVTQYTAQTVPELLNGLADLLQANIEQMKSADQQIAENIPSSLG